MWQKKEHDNDNSLKSKDPEPLRTGLESYTWNEYNIVCPLYFHKNKKKEQAGIQAIIYP